MIRLLADIHSNFSLIYDLIYSSHRGDLILLLGDVCFNTLRYYPDGKLIERQIKERISNECEFRGVQVACVHGNHEERVENISIYHEFKWHEGIAYREKNAPNIIFLKDGEIYHLEGNKSFLVCGGAWSADQEFRKDNNYPWWKDEQPSEATKNKILKTIQGIEYKVDYILTHTCPYKYIPEEVSINKGNNSDRSTELFFDLLEEKLDYKVWFCGHWHCDKRIDKIQFVYREEQTIQGDD